MAYARWTIKPNWTVALHQAHPIASRLAAYIPINEGMGFPREVVRMRTGDTLNGGTWASRLKGSAVTLDAAAEFIRYPATTDYQLSGDGGFTAIVSVNITGTNGGFPALLGHRTSFGAGMWELYQESSTIRFGFWTTGFVSLDFGVALGTGDHIYAVTREPGGTYRLFDNGLQIATQSNAGVPTGGSHVLYIGALGGDENANNVFGHYDWVGIWNRALGPDEILMLMQDPYLLLKPVVTRYYLYVPAARRFLLGTH